MAEEKPRIAMVRPTGDRSIGAQTLRILETRYRIYPEAEIIPYARNTSFVEIAEHVVPDRDGPYANPLYLFTSRHSTTIGVRTLSRKTKEFLEKERTKSGMDILSISAGMDEDRLMVVALVRVYGKKPKFAELSGFLGEKKEDDGEKEKGPRLLIPPGAYRKITEEERKKHREAVRRQARQLEKTDEDKPFLNSIERYTPLNLSEIDERQEMVYDLRTKDMQIQLNEDYDDFIAVFNECMDYITSTEKDTYYNVLKGQTEKKDFFDVVEAYIQRRLPREDLPALMGKIDRALFELYIVQDLIDDPMITDIKITDPDSIRVRIKGRAYLSNITFIDDRDYLRFITGVAVNNGIDLRIPTQTFVDEQDENYKLRFSITSPYITCNGYPYIHIRKVPRKKLMSQELIEAGMFDEKIRDYLMDCGKYSKGVVFAGPPGSGKTTCLNWFLEDAYESSAEILVIQENDELFAYRKGVMLQHVVLNPQRGEEPCTLERLGQMALVAGANVFVIGEAKGAEICSAITLSNSGCRTAITIHSQSSTDTVDKMVDLALRGSPNTSYDQAKRMIKSFQTIVYLEDFKVMEISEITGYDEVKKDMVYRAIYRR